MIKKFGFNKIIGGAIIGGIVGGVIYALTKKKVDAELAFEDEFDFGFELPGDDGYTESEEVIDSTPEE
jgi:hypothetical protein